tara:strand:- start:1580 stop:2683 length:1104 start_codon:yes stop_codon:yes gene_type:complete
VSIKINKAVQKSKPYKLVTQKAWNEKNHSNVLKLDWNESTILPSPKVINALKDLVNNGSLNWYPNINNEELISKLAQYCKVNKDNIQYFNGSDSIHEAIFKTFSSDGDRLTIVGPTYDHPRSVAECFGLKIDYFYTNSKNFTFCKTEFINHIKDIKPHLAYICTPNNPTGNSIDHNDIESVIKMFPQILFIVDEAYIEFGKESCNLPSEKYRNLIITRTFSKAFGLASLRIGYCISNKVNIDMMNKFRNPKSINLFAQVGAIAALEDINYTQEYVNNVKTNREIFIEKMKNDFSNYLSAFKSDGNFVLLKMNKNYQPERLMKSFEDKKIYIRNYSHIKGLENCIRITIGNEKQTNKVIDLLSIFFNN